MGRNCKVSDGLPDPDIPTARCASRPGQLLTDRWYHRGAALSLIPQKATVTSISATRHYGVEAFTPLVHEEDKGQAVFTGIDGKKRVRKVSNHLKYIPKAHTECDGW